MDKPPAHYTGSSVKALAQAYQNALKTYPRLMKIVDEPRGADRKALMHANVNAKHYDQIFFGIGDEKYNTGKGNFGGRCNFFRPANGRDGKTKAVIFIMTNTALKPDELAYMNLPIFFHELGHVDDFLKGLYLLPDGKEIDITGAEYYAHQFCCRNLYEGGFSVCMSLWLRLLELQHSKCGLPTQEKAAQMLLDSAEYPRYRKLAEPFMHMWEETFGGQSLTED